MFYKPQILTHTGTVRAEGGSDTLMCVVHMENFMKAMNLVGISMVGAMSLFLSGCGGGSGGGTPAAGAPVNPYGQGGYYNQQVNQPYTCPTGQIQFRNAFGNPQCFPTTVLSEACAQAGGILSTNAATCRKERNVFSGSYHRIFAPVNLWSLIAGRRERGTFTYTIPLRAQLFGGEALKVYGDVDTVNSDTSEWNAQLLQNGVAVGSASAESMMSSDGVNNLSITAMSSGVQQNYYQNGTYNQGQIPQQYTNNGQYPYNGQVQYSGQFQGQQSTMGMTQNYSLQLLLRSGARVTLNGAAISCEDGRGNSYPCQ